MTSKSRKLLLILSATACLATSCGGGKIDHDPDMNVDPSKHDDITLTTYFPNFGCDDRKVKDGFLAKELQSLTTYNVTFNQLPENSADTEINKLLSMHEPVDMLKCAPTVFNNYVASGSGYFTNLTPLVEKYGNTPVDSKGTKFVDLFTKEQWDACTYDGKIYAVPEYGHTAMANNALVWNKDHLEAVGITKIPETIGEFYDAVTKLQAHFGADNINYHAFGLAGSMPLNTEIAAAFNVPMQWYENSNGDLEHMIYSNEMESFLKFMNELKRKEILVGDWVGQTEMQIIYNFSLGNCSVFEGSYWNMTPCRESMIATYEFPGRIVGEKQKRNLVYGTTTGGKLKDDAIVSYRVGIKGDGTHGSVTQSKPMFRDNRTVGYFITIPAVNAKRAAYTFDWIIRKNTEEATQLMVAGKEGVHFDYCDAGDEGAIKLICDTPTYVKKYDKFNDDISGMSQFQTAVYCDVARKWWPIAEAGFNGWDVLITDSEGKEDMSSVINNKFALHPVIASFAKYDLQAQNYIITEAQQIINTVDDAKFASELAITRDYYNVTYYSKFANDINSWYRAHK